MFTTLTGDALIEWCERCRWPRGIVCPFCGQAITAERYRLPGTSRSIRKCGACGRQVSVTARTRLDHTHLPLHLWVRAVVLLTGGAWTAAALARDLGIAYRSAKSMETRLRPVAGRTRLSDPFTLAPATPERVFERLLRERRPVGELS